MWLEWLIQFGPVTIFFLVFELSGKNFFAATAVFMVTTVVAVGLHFLRSRKVALFPVFGASFVLLFGGATLWFHNSQFLIVRDTLYDGVFGLALLVSLALKRNLLKAFFEPLFAMSDRGWHTLAVRWAVFFLVAAVANEVVRQNFSDGFWVRYKIVNTLVFVAFGFYQFTLTKRERLPEYSNSLGMRVKAPILPHV